MLIDFQQMQDDVTTTKEAVFMIREQIKQGLTQGTDEKPFTVGEAAEFLGIAEQTIYQNIKKVPHRKRFGRLYFFKSELLAYIDGKEVGHE